jgi:hypothetical protein
MIVPAHGSSEMPDEPARDYWAVFSAGHILIRRMSLAPLKAEAERRFRPAAAAGTRA